MASSPYSKPSSSPPLPQLSHPRRRELPERGDLPSPASLCPLTQSFSATAAASGEFSALFWPGCGSSAGCLNLCWWSLRALFFDARIVGKMLALLIWLKFGLLYGWLLWFWVCWWGMLLLVVWGWWLCFKKGSANLFDCCFCIEKYCLFLALLPFTIV